MVRVIVLVGVIVAVVFSGGVLADVSFNGLTVVVRRADGAVVTGRVTRATEIVCALSGQRACDRGSLKQGTVVLKADVRRLGNGVMVFRRLELAT